ncbi:MAG: hypothetical protein U9R16_01830 [Campylobacterota bacterium]|nr:hypothetical protein [Campylobacterota bacterium]
MYLKLLFLFSIILSPLVVSAKEGKIVESQPQILFEHENLTNLQEKRELIVKFNTAVLYLEQEKFLQAIQLFKESSKLLKVASFLNIGIAYYKLDSQKNSYLYLKKIYELKELQNNDKYSYFSAAYYLYKITKDKKYINEITKIGAKAKRLTEHEKMLVVDTLILQKRYKYALKLLKTTQNRSKLKEALLNIKLRDYKQARINLNIAYDHAKGDEDKNDILWFKVFRDLKANDLINLGENILKIEERKKIFFSNKKMQLKLFFNKDKFTSKEYFDKITNFTLDRKLNFVFYFAPFIFEDYDRIDEDTTKSFIIKDQNSINELNMMVKYNADFLKVIKLDPIHRVQVLQDMIDLKFDTNPYEYYNLGLAYAQIYDFNNAYKNFKKAYSLEHGNKLYSVMTILTAKKINLTINKTQKEFMVKNILSKNGSFRYLAKYLYKIFENPSLKLDIKDLTNIQKRSIFFRAIYFLENVEKNGIKTTEPLLVEFSKDPFVKLLTLVAREPGEGDYVYISRLQDKLPKIYNNNFLKGSLVITDYYLDTLRALGLFNRTDFNIDKELDPSYLRLKAIVDLYQGKAKSSIKLIEYIQKKYNLESLDSFYILIGSLFASKQDLLAYVALSEIEFLYDDKDAKFLDGIKLIQDLKLNTVPQYFKYKLKGKLVDFKLVNFDEFLETL